MDASISSDVRFVCPYCTHDKFIVVRRRIEEDDTLVKTCRCEACGDQFEYAEDREGTPIHPGKE